VIEKKQTLLEEGVDSPKTGKPFKSLKNRKAGIDFAKKKKT